MHIERIGLRNFRCFGPERTEIPLDASLTAFVGVNGSGKTAVMQVFQRMFGVTADQRRFRRRDFHVPANEKLALTERHLELDAILAFPELDEDAESTAVPAFFQHMAADENGRLKCRLVLRATWTDDGTSEGSVEETYWAVRTFGEFEAEDCVQLKAADRARIQFIYVPATRDGASQVASFLKGRLWRAIQWSDNVRTTLNEAGESLTEAFSKEAAIGKIEEMLQGRWSELHSAGTDARPVFRPIDTRIQEFISRVEVVFKPGDDGRDRDVSELSDGQRSLFHLALTAAALDIEANVARASPLGFLAGEVLPPALTMIGLEEPENTLAPFYLSRILKQVMDLAQSTNAQAVVSSHSAGILARVKPEAVRHFRLSPERSAVVKAIRLPVDVEEASKYVREAVRSYPELYFARFVVLGEGATEEVVLPRVARALGVTVDHSFVAMVPLGGRHVSHLWRLLTELQIPYATLLDLDWGRSGGGWGRIKNVCEQLIACGTRPDALFSDARADDLTGTVHLGRLLNNDVGMLDGWLDCLARHGVYFSSRLDLDYSMLQAFRSAYMALEPGATGPRSTGNVREAVLGAEGKHDEYGPTEERDLLWYRYLFLGRGKPSTHVRVLSSLSDDQVKAGTPPYLKRLVQAISSALAAPGEI